MPSFSKANIKTKIMIKKYTNFPIKEESTTLPVPSLLSTLVRLINFVINLFKNPAMNHPINRISIAPIVVGKKSPTELERLVIIFSK